MKRIIDNKYQLTEEDINIKCTRVKAVVIKEGKILLGNESGVLQFPGGHLEEGEFLNEGLIREIEEELGIELEIEEISEPYLKISYYKKDSPEKGINESYDIYYYVINTVKEINLKNTNYTEEEKEKKFEIVSVDLNKVVDYLKDNIKNHKENEIITPEMLIALEEFFNIEKEEN
ncbi:MAG: NUDIX domain-containing protein [bacterium]